MKISYSNTKKSISYLSTLAFIVFVSFIFELGMAGTGIGPVCFGNKKDYPTGPTTTVCS